MSLPKLDPNGKSKQTVTPDREVFEEVLTNFKQMRADLTEMEDCPKATVK